LIDSEIGLKRVRTLRGKNNTFEFRKRRQHTMTRWWRH